METMLKALELAQRIGFVFIATTDEKGVPHIAAARTVDPLSGNRMGVTEWFCPGTMKNLRNNRHIALALWDQRLAAGYQLIGQVEEVEELSILNGYSPHQEGEDPGTHPQVEIRLTVKIDRILEFAPAPHSDQEV